MINVYTDGASQGDPGPSGAGIYIETQTEKFNHSTPLPDMSNHEAEFQAVRHALTICRDQFPGEILSLRSDSKVVVDAIQKNHTKNKTFQPLLKEIAALIEDFPHVFIKWIPEAQNSLADKLAKQAVHER